MFLFVAQFRLLSFVWGSVLIVLTFWTPWVLGGPSVAYRFVFFTTCLHSWQRHFVDYFLKACSVFNWTKRWVRVVLRRCRLWVVFTQQFSFHLVDTKVWNSGSDRWLALQDHSFVTYKITWTVKSRFFICWLSLLMGLLFWLTMTFWNFFHAGYLRLIDVSYASVLTLIYFTVFLLLEK